MVSALQNGQDNHPTLQQDVASCVGTGRDIVEDRLRLAVARKPGFNLRQPASADIFIF